jgi:hypothetical protein
MLKRSYARLSAASATSSFVWPKVAMRFACPENYYPSKVSCMYFEKKMQMGDAQVFSCPT